MPECSEAELRLARLMERFLSPLAEKLGFDVGSVEEVSFDPEGPRVGVRCGPTPDYESLTVDVSPDGVEMVASFPAPKGLSVEDVDAALGVRIEEGEEFEQIEEYDVAYDPEEGEVVVTLHARTVNALPSVQTLRRVVEEVLESLQGSPGNGF